MQTKTEPEDPEFAAVEPSMPPRQPYWGVGNQASDQRAGVDSVEATSIPQGALDPPNLAGPVLGAAPKGSGAPHARPLRLAGKSLACELAASSGHS